MFNTIILSFVPPPWIESVAVKSTVIICLTMMVQVFVSVSSILHERIRYCWNQPPIWFLFLFYPPLRVLIITTMYSLLKPGIICSAQLDGDDPVGLLQAFPSSVCVGGVCLMQQLIFKPRARLLNNHHRLIIPHNLRQHFLWL
jgi:hypothetical protein